MPLLQGSLDRAFAVNDCTSVLIYEGVPAVQLISSVDERIPDTEAESSHSPSPSINS